MNQYQDDPLLQYEKINSELLDIHVKICFKSIDYKYKKK